MHTYAHTSWSDPYAVQNVRSCVGMYKIFWPTVFLHMVVITRSLHSVHEINAYRAGRVCPSICPHDSTLEPLNGFG
jgi:hypothetical protein